MNGRSIQRFSTAAFTALLLCLSMSAQEADAGSWVSLQANKRWTKAYSFLRAEHRTCSSFGQTECWFTAIGGGYSFLPWLNADLSYEFWRIYPSSQGTVTNHKIVLSTTGTLRRDALSVALREKLEYAVNPAGTNSLTLRSRLRAQYSFKVFRPYMMAELFTQDRWIRSLYYAGTDIILSAHHAFDVFYMYHVPNGTAPVHTVGFGYCFSF